MFLPQSYQLLIGIWRLKTTGIHFSRQSIEYHNKRTARYDLLLEKLYFLHNN